MTDVAHRAGVSVSTVSYALTGARPISAATRERIERAMAELNYTPNAFARGLKSKRSRILALLFPTRVSGLGLSSLEYILGASDHAQERGYHLLLWTTDPHELGDLAQLAGQGLIAGVLLMEVTLADPRLPVLRRAGVPVTMIGRTAEPTEVDYLDTDFDQAAQTAVDYLVAEGHRHLGFLNLPSSVLRAGRGNAVRLRDALRRSARRSRAHLVSLPCESTAHAGRAAFSRFIQRDPDLTAVISFNEQAIPGVIAAAAEQQWSVPADLAIVAVDLPPQAAEMTLPPMTTVGPSAAEMGSRAVEVLIRRAEGDKGPPHQELFEGRLEVRGSSGPAPCRTPR